MNTNKAYWLMLIIVLMAWFLAFVPPSPPLKVEKNEKENVSVEPVHIVTDLLSLWVSSSNWIAGGNCNIERMNSEVMGTSVYDISKNKPLKLEGWAMDSSKARLPKSTVVRFTNSESIHFYALAQSGLVRDDVQRYLNLTDNLKRSGFELNTNIGELPEGEYALTLLLLFKDIKLICDNGRKISVQ